MQFLGNHLADTLDAADGLTIQFLWRELDGGIARMDTGKLDVLADGIGDNLTVLGHGIHLHLLGMLNELAHHHGMVFRHIGCKTEEAFQLVFVGTYIHRST